MSGGGIGNTPPALPCARAPVRANVLHVNLELLDGPLHDLPALRQAHHNAAIVIPHALQVMRVERLVATGDDDGEWDICIAVLFVPMWEVLGPDDCNETSAGGRVQHAPPNLAGGKVKVEMEEEGG